MVVKQSTKGKAAKGASKASPSVAKTVAEKSISKSVSAKKVKELNASPVAGWIQDASLETSLASIGYEPKPGEREVEFSVAMRRREEDGKSFAELRGRALIHAAGTVLALAEASYIAELVPNTEEPVIVKAMYPSLREALQGLLQMAGHTPPLPESLENAAS